MKQLPFPSFLHFAFVFTLFSLSAPFASGQIEVSPSGHYFTFNGKPTMLVGDSGTQCVMQNLNLDYRRWVDTLAEEGHSTAHIWAFVAPRQMLNGGQLEDRWGYRYPGITPWARHTSGGSAYDGGKKWDLQTFDEGTDPNAHYWPRLRDLCSRLKSKDMMLGITVFFGWPKYYEDIVYHPFYNLNGGPAVDLHDITYVHSPGEEVHSEEFSSSWPVRKQTQWYWEKYALKLIETADACGNVWFDFRDEWSYDNFTNAETHFRQFFMSRNVLWADRSNEADFRVHNPDVPPFGSTPAMKTEGAPYDHKGVRNDVWAQVLNGIHFVLHNDARDPGIMVWDSKTARIKSLTAASDFGRKYVGYASRFMNTYVKDLDSLVPRSDLASGAGCLANAEKEYVIYLPDGDPVQINLGRTSEEVFSVRWYNPFDGLVSATAQIEGGGIQIFTPPSRHSWVLHLVAASLEKSQPSSPTVRLEH